MANIRDISEIVKFIQETDDSFKRSLHVAALRTATKAEQYAKENAKRQFIGRNNRTLSGTLLNSIYSRVEKKGESFAVHLGVANIPYGAIHEFGGTIKPVKAKKLWIPTNLSERVSPREFIQMKDANPSAFFLTDKVAAKKEGTRIVPLFFLVDEATIPERPYLRPALERAFNELPAEFSKYFERQP